MTSRLIPLLTFIMILGLCQGCASKLDEQKPSDESAELRKNNTSIEMEAAALQKEYAVLNETAVRTKEDLQRSVNTLKGALSYIYKQALKNNPDIKGSILLTLIVEPDGKARSCRIVASQFRDPQFESKVLAQFCNHPYGNIDGAGDYYFAYPLDFHPI